jgi:hypothetical protein
MQAGKAEKQPPTHSTGDTAHADSMPYVAITWVQAHLTQSHGVMNRVVTRVSSTVWPRLAVINMTKSCQHPCVMHIKLEAKIYPCITTEYALHAPEPEVQHCWAGQTAAGCCTLDSAPAADGITQNQTYLGWYICLTVPLHIERFWSNTAPQKLKHQLQIRNHAERAACSTEQRHALW